MIETQSDIDLFKEENASGDWIIHIVSEDDRFHPCDTRPCVLFIKNLQTQKVYCLSINHPDSNPQFSIEKFIADIQLFKNIKWSVDKKSLLQFYPFFKVYDANLIEYLSKNKIIDTVEFETVAHGMINRHSLNFQKIARIIPIVKHKEYFESLCAEIEPSIKNYHPDTSFFRINDIVIPTLSSIESNGVYVDKERFNNKFGVIPNKQNIVFTQYNIYTATGRPSNKFDGVNYAALNQTDGSRSCFVSRYGNDGQMLMVDYKAFHPRIICNLTNFSIPIETDIYAYLARLCYNKKEVDETDVKNAKQLTFRQLYGGVEDKYSHIKYFANLKTFINEQWDMFQKNGYVETLLFKRKITPHHIQDPNPNKLFNYILQATEGEIAIPRLQMVQEYLKNKKTKPVLYIYDAILYDFHKNDGIETLKEMQKIMSLDGKFPLKTYIGKSYGELKITEI